MKAWASVSLPSRTVHTPPPLSVTLQSTQIPTYPQCRCWFILPQKTDLIHFKAVSCFSYSSSVITLSIYSVIQRWNQMIVETLTLSHCLKKSAIQPLHIHYFCCRDHQALHWQQFYTQVSWRLYYQQMNMSFILYEFSRGVDSSHMTWTRVRLESQIWWL